MCGWGESLRLYTRWQGHKHQPITVGISHSYIHTNGLLRVSNLPGFVSLQIVGRKISEKYATAAQKWP